MTYCPHCEKRVEGCVHQEVVSDADTKAARRDILRGLRLEPSSLQVRPPRKYQISPEMAADLEQAGMPLDGLGKIPRDEPDISGDLEDASHILDSEKRASLMSYCGCLTTGDLERLVKAHELGQAVAAIRKDDHLIMLSFNAVVAGHGTCNIVVQPQVVCTPVRLVYGGPKYAFRLVDFQIGKNSQLGHPTTGGISMDCFPPHPENGEPIDNFSGLDVIHITMYALMQVKNTTPFQQDFSAVLYARIIKP